MYSSKLFSCNVQENWFDFEKKSQTFERNIFSFKSGKIRFHNDLCFP